MLNETVDGRSGQCVKSPSAFHGQYWAIVFRTFPSSGVGANRLAYFDSGSKNVLTLDGLLSHHERAPMILFQPMMDKSRIKTILLLGSNRLEYCFGYDSSLLCWGIYICFSFPRTYALLSQDTLQDQPTHFSIHRRRVIHHCSDATSCTTVPFPFRFSP